MGQTDGLVEVLYAEEHQVLSETNNNSRKTSPGETIAQFAFQAIRFCIPKQKMKNLNLKRCHGNTVSDHSRAPDILAKKYKNN